MIARTVMHSSGFLRLCVIGVVASITSWSNALAASVEFSAKIARLMEVSGINHAITQVSPGILAGFDAGDPRQPMPANIRAALRDAAIQGFLPAPMTEKVRAKLAGALKEKELDDALAWMDTPLGRRITALENASHDPAEMAKLQAYTAELQKRPAPASRVRLIQDLNRATGAEDMLNTITEATVLATNLGINAAQPGQHQAPVDMTKKHIAGNMPQIRKQTAQFVVTALLYTYRSLTDQELDSYIKFSRSASGAAYNKITVAGFSEAMIDAIGRFMTAIPKAMERTRGAVGT